MNPITLLKKIKAAHAQRARIKKDARILGSQNWAEKLNGWYDDVSIFTILPDGRVRLNEFNLVIPESIANWLVAHDPNASWAQKRTYEWFRKLWKHGVKFSIDADETLIATYNGVNYVLTSSSICVLYEILPQSGYALQIPSSPLLIFDIGMNVGFASLFFASQFPDATIEGFEPFKPTFDALEENLRRNPEVNSRITPHRIALSNHDAEELWYLNTDHISSSAFEIRNEQSTRVQVTVRSAAKTLRPILEAHPNHFCLLKMDCEGGEYAIFEDIQKANLFQKIDLLIMEYHEMDGHSREKLETCLQDNGFIIRIEPNHTENAKGHRAGVITAFNTHPEKP